MKAIYDSPLPEGWSEEPLANLVVTRRGYTWEKADEADSARVDTVPVIRIPNVQDTLDLTDLVHLRNVSPEALQKAAVTKDWLLFVGSNGTQDRIGDSVLIEEDRPMVFASFLMGIQPKDQTRLRSDFFAHWMRLHLVHEMFSKTSQQTTGLANFSWSAVKRLPVRFPDSTEEQRRIGASLKLADESVRLARAQLTATKDVKRSLLASVFEKGLRRAITMKPCKIHRCFTASVPAHWDDERLGRSLELVEYGTNSPSNDHRSGYPVIAIPQVVAPHLSLTDVPFAEVPQAEADALRLMQDDVLLIRTNGNPEYIGKSTIVSAEVAEVHTIYASYLIRVRPKRENVLGAYLNYFLASPLGRRQAGAAANTSAGNNNIGARAIKQFRFPRPPLAEQREIVDLLDATERQIDVLTRKLVAAEDVKRSLLQDLLIGRIRIPEGAIHA